MKDECFDSSFILHPSSFLKGGAYPSCPCLADSLAPEPPASCASSVDRAGRNAPLSCVPRSLRPGLVPRETGVTRLRSNSFTEVPSRKRPDHSGGVEAGQQQLSFTFRG